MIKIIRKGVLSNQGNLNEVFFIPTDTGFTVYNYTKPSATPNFTTTQNGFSID